MKSEFYPMRYGSSKEGLLNLIEYISSLAYTKGMSMIEIGSYIGESSVMFAEYFKMVYTVDPYDDTFFAGFGVEQYAKADRVYEKYLENTKDILNIYHIRKISDTAIMFFKYMFVDFVYIDGLHTYEQVCKDINNYLPLIRNGGFIGGHDYVTGWEGVIKAVNELLGEPDMVFIDGSWIKQLKK
jgi:predicted O-methyltransferase YrrM